MTLFTPNDRLKYPSSDEIAAWAQQPYWDCDDAVVRIARLTLSDGEDSRLRVTNVLARFKDFAAQKLIDKGAWVEYCKSSGMELPTALLMGEQEQGRGEAGLYGALLKSINELETDARSRKQGDPIGSTVVTNIVTKLKGVARDSANGSVDALLAENQQQAARIKELDAALAKVSKQPSSGAVTGDLLSQPYLNAKHPHYSPKISALIHCWIDQHQNGGYSDKQGKADQAMQWLRRNRDELATHQSGPHKGADNAKNLKEHGAIMACRIKN